MVDLAFHHGTRVFESKDESIQIRTAQSAVIFLQGTAPDADPTEFPLNEPVLIKGSANYDIAAHLGDAGTLKKALHDIWQQGDRMNLGAYVYINRVEHSSSAATMFSNNIGDPALKTGIYAALRIESKFGRRLRPRIFIAPGFTHAMASDGITAINVTQQGSGYTSPPTVQIAGASGKAEAVAVVADGKVTSVIVKRPGYGFSSAPAITLAGGGGADATATAAVGAVGNPVAHELVGLLPKMRAVGIIDGPNTTSEAAVITTTKYGSDRLYVVDPFLLAWDTQVDAYVPRPASPRFAGIQVRVDREVGFHKSLSNELIYGIDGPVRPVTYGDESNYLNENNVGTIVHYSTGYRSWGNRTTDGSFLSVRRSKDFINEAIEEAYMAFIDRPMNDANLQFLVTDAKRFLRTLEINDALLRGSSDVWLDPAKNPKESMKQGRITLSVKYEVPPPIEDIVIQQHGNLLAYDLLIDRVNGAIEAGSLTL